MIENLVAHRFFVLKPMFQKGAVLVVGVQGGARISVLESETFQNIKPSRFPSLA